MNPFGTESLWDNLVPRPPGAESGGQVGLELQAEDVVANNPLNAEWIQYNMPQKLVAITGPGTAGGDVNFVMVNFAGSPIGSVNKDMPARIPEGMSVVTEVELTTVPYEDLITDAAALSTYTHNLSSVRTYRIAPFPGAQPSGVDPFQYIGALNRALGGALTTRNASRKRDDDEDDEDDTRNVRPAQRYA